MHGARGPGSHVRPWGPVCSVFDDDSRLRNRHAAAVRSSSRAELALAGIFVVDLAERGVVGERTISSRPCRGVEAGRLVDVENGSG